MSPTVVITASLMMVAVKGQQQCDTFVFIITDMAVVWGPLSLTPSVSQKANEAVLLLQLLLK